MANYQDGGEFLDFDSEVGTAAVTESTADEVGGDLLSVANSWVDLAEEADRLETALESVRAKLKAREAVILDQMAAGAMDRITVRGRTLYPIRDSIVGRAKGVSADDLIIALRHAGLGDIVGEKVQANTLKATIKEIRNRAIDAGHAGGGMKCTLCGRVHSVEARSCDTCATNTRAWSELIPCIDGIDAELWAMLYVEDRLKLGCRSSK